MKKIIVLAIVGLFVASFAMAQDVTLSGEVESRYLQDFNNKAFQQSPQVEVKLDAMVDETASLYIEMEENGLGASGIGDNFDKAHFTLDLGAIAGLPVGVTVRTGYDEYDIWDAVKVTTGEYEDIIGADMTTWGHEINIMVNEMVSLRGLWANDPALEYWSAGLAVTYEPVYVEVSYVNIDAVEQGEGNLDAGVQFGQEVSDGIDLGVAVTLDYDLSDTTSGDAVWAIGAGVNVDYQGMAALGIAFRGMDGSEANSMQIDVSATPVEAITLYLIAGLGLDDAIYADAFESFEGSVKYSIGPSTWYTGLLWSAETAPVVIASEKADFVAETADMMGLFVRGELKY